MANPDLAARLREAITSYEARWKPVDSELYDLCRRRASHRDFADVYTKSAIVGRVYQAGCAAPGEATVIPRPKSPAS